MEMARTSEGPPGSSATGRYEESPVVLPSAICVMTNGELVPTSALPEPEPVVLKYAYAIPPPIISNAIVELAKIRFLP